VLCRNHRRPQMSERGADRECSNTRGIEEQQFAEPVGFHPLCCEAPGRIEACYRPGRSKGVLPWEVKWFVLPVLKERIYPYVFCLECRLLAVMKWG
jgi:hypothetical protein